MKKGLLTSFILLISAILYFSIIAPEKVIINNLLIITIDTVRADTFYAPDDNQFSDRLTPWLKKARVYRDAQSVAPWTIPAIATVLTGYTPNQHGAGAFKQKLANLDTELPSSVLPEVQTLAERLVKLKFTTLAASAHPWFSSEFGLQRGFEKIDGTRFRENIDSWFVKSIKKRTQKQSQSQVQHRNFTYLHYMEAHGRHTRKLNEYFPILTRAQKDRGFSWSGSACKAGVETTICHRYLVYTQAVLDLRDSLANVLEQLDSSGLLDQTLVVVYSDHGEEFHEHLAQAKADNHDPRGTYGFGHGNSMYEEQLRIPLLVWNPNDSEGRVVTNPVSLLDIAPSILDWLGVDTSTDNFPGMLLDEAEKQSDRVLFASNIAYGPEQISVRNGNFKSIWNTVTDESRYFDLEIDPDELRPLYSDELVLHFDKLTGDYLDLASANIGETPVMDAEQLERLKSIGYLQGSDATAPTNTDANPKPTPETDLPTGQVEIEANQAPETETQ